MRLAGAGAAFTVVPLGLTPYVVQPDNFALFMFLGALALWLCARGMRGDRRAFVLGGLVVGLATLTRTDGVLLALPYLVAFRRGVDLRASVGSFVVFALGGALTGLAALLNSVRFNQIPSNTGLGLELKVIAAVVVGGTAITGGRGSATGTLLGVLLLGAIGPALTFLGVSAYWERAIQGAIILTAVAVDAVRPAFRVKPAPA